MKRSEHRWVVEIVTARNRRLSLVAHDEANARRGYRTLVRSAGCVGAELELVHVVIDDVGRELSREVLEKFQRVPS